MDDASATYAAMGQFNQTLIFERTAPSATLLNELTVISEFDKEAEFQSSKWGWRLAFAVFAAIGSIVMTFLSFANNRAPLGILGLIILVTAIGIGIYFGTKYAQWSRRNIENRRYELVNELLRHLSCDMAADSPVSLRLDGNNYHKPEYISALEGQSLMATGQKSYRLPWLALSGQFVDGHRFTFSTTQLVKRKEKRKRKYVKVKEAVCERVELEVRCKSHKYARWPDLPLVLKKLKVNLPLQTWDLQVTGDKVTLVGLMQRAVKISGRGTTGSHEPGLVNPQAALGLFALLYRGLDEVRK